MNEELKIDERPIVPLFRKLFFPIVIEQLFGMLLGSIDVLMLSQYSDASVAATGLSNQLINVGLMILGIASLGSGILLMQTAGTHDQSEVSLIIRHGVDLNVIISIIMSAVFLLFGRQLLSWIQTPQELIDSSYNYLAIVSVSLIFQSVMTSFGSIFRSFTYVRIVMIASIATNILSILGNYIVLFTQITLLGSGIHGVAVSTLIARFIGMIFLMLAFYHFLPDYKQAFSSWRLQGKTIRAILDLGFPSALENISYTSSQTIITGIIASFGAVMVTSKIYTQNITGVIFTIAAAISQANQIIIGRYIGLKQKDYARDYTIKLIVKSVILAFGLSLVLALISPWIIGWLTKDTDIQKIVLQLIWISIILEPGRLSNEILIGALNTAGDVKFPTAISIASTFLVHRSNELSYRYSLVLWTCRCLDCVHYR
ncbi:MATE family efflux transporter [Aerococcaceae bacterium WGS1372]